MPELSVTELYKRAGYASAEAFYADMRDETGPGALAKRREEHRERIAKAEAAQAVELAKCGPQGAALLAEQQMVELAKSCSIARGLTEAEAHAWLAENSGAYRDAYSEMTKARRTSPTVIEDLPASQHDNIALTDARSQMTEMVRVYATTHSLDYERAMMHLEAHSPEYQALMRIGGPFVGRRFDDLQDIADRVARMHALHIKKAQKAQDLAGRVEKLVKLHRERGESDGQVLQRLNKLGHTTAVGIVAELLG